MIGKISLKKIEFFNVKGVDVSDCSNSKWNYIAIEDRGLFISGNTKITLSRPLLEGHQPKYLAISVLPLRGEVDAFANIEVKGASRIETYKVSYITWDIETSQLILIKLKDFNDIEWITIHTKSHAVLCGIWQSD